MENKLSTKNTINFFKRNKKTLLITFIVSAVVSRGLSLLLPNYYKAQVLLLPSAVNSISKAILNDGDKLDPYLFGKEKDSEYILEMLGSGEILGKTVGKFNLKEHYGIKEDGNLGDELVYLKLQKNIKIKRSDFLGVKLIVWDKDPKYAADIANYMTEQLSNLRYRMKQAKSDSIKMCLERTRFDLEQEYLQYKDSLHRVMTESNIYSPLTYSDRVMQEMSKQIAAGNTAGVQRLEAKMAHLVKYVSDINKFSKLVEEKQELWKTWDQYYHQAILDLEANIPTDFVVEYAYPSGAKDKPKRSIIVLISALLCTVIAAEVLVLREKRNSSKTKNEQTPEV